MTEAAPSLSRGAMAITLATVLSRITGFLRVVVVAAAMGTTFMANTYQTANTAPNVLFELLAAGILTSVFVPTFVDFLVARRRAEGWVAGDILTTAAVVGLCALAAVLALAAPLVMRLLTAGVEDPALRAREIEVGSALLRLFAPQVVLYGLGMIMTAALHAHRRFGLAAAAPIGNNIVVIGVYLAYAQMRGRGAPSLDSVGAGEIWLLGAGTTAGVAVMTLVLVPRLRSLGWRYRWRWDPHHPLLRKSLRLGAWALGYAGGYQAGLIVVLVLANRIEGGVAAYQWAYTFFYLPHALFSVPIFSVLFTAMAEHAAKKEVGELRRRMTSGVTTLLFLLIPVSLGLVVVAEPLAESTLVLGVMTPSGAAMIGRVLAAFALGLPFFSLFLVYTRAFYATGETRMPALVNGLSVVTASATGVVAFLLLPDRWAVAGLALGHSLGAAVGCVVLARSFRKKVTGAPVVLVRPLVPLFAGGVAATAVLIPAALLAAETEARIEQWGWLGLGACVAAVTYLVSTAKLGSPEPARLLSLLRRPATPSRGSKDG